MTGITDAAVKSVEEPSVAQGTSNTRDHARYAIAGTIQQRGDVGHGQHSPHLAIRHLPPVVGKYVIPVGGFGLIVAVILWRLFGQKGACLGCCPGLHEKLSFTSSLCTSAKEKERRAKEQEDKEFYEMDGRRGP